MVTTVIVVVEAVLLCGMTCSKRMQKSWRVFKMIWLNQPRAGNHSIKPRISLFFPAFRRVRNGDSFNVGVAERAPRSSSIRPRLRFKKGRWGRFSKWFCLVSSMICIIIPYVYIYIYINNINIWSKCIHMIRNAFLHILAFLVTAKDLALYTNVPRNDWRNPPWQSLALEFRDSLAAQYIWTWLDNLDMI